MEDDMAKYTASQAKNLVKRSLRRVLDPGPVPSEIDQLWAHFLSACSYCGATLTRDERDGHLDHLVPTSRGGTNEIFNHVLACGKCNGDEKRDAEWEAFLASKATNGEVLAERRGRIADWTARSIRCPPSADTLQEADAIIDGVIRYYDEALASLRRMRP
jgi:hypothetical protein